MTKQQLLTIDGFKEKMAIKLHDGIQDKVNNASLSKIMAVSNMFGRGFSDKKVELILEQYPNILNSSEDAKIKIDKLSKVKGMASKTAQAFVEKIPDFLGFLQKCSLEKKLELSKKENTSQIDMDHILYKKSVVMSGTREKDLEGFLKKVGANLGSTVTSKTYALITPDPNSNTGKVTNAKKLNVSIYSPNEFKKTFM